MDRRTGFTVGSSTSSSSSLRNLSNQISALDSRAGSVNERTRLLASGQSSEVENGDRPIHRSFTEELDEGEELDRPNGDGSKDGGAADGSTSRRHSAGRECFLELCHQNLLHYQGLMLSIRS